MSNKKLVDYIITLYDNQDKDYPYRLRALNIILGSIPTNINVIIVEQMKSNQKRTYTENLKRFKNVNFISKKFDGYFNKSWLYNIGAKNAITNTLLFAESDNFQEPLYYKNILDYHIRHKHLKWFICWDQLIYLGKNDNIVEKVVKNPKTHGYAEGGLILFRKEFFYKIGGYNEWYECLGGMDNDISWRADVLSNQFVHMPGTIYHYWHPKSSLKGSYDKEHNIIRKRNIDTYNNLRKNKNFSILLQQYSTKIGGDEPLCVKLKNPLLVGINDMKNQTEIPQKQNETKKLNNVNSYNNIESPNKINIKPFKKLEFK